MLRDLSPSLKAGADPARTDCRRTAPALVGSRNDNAGPASDTANKSDFRNGQDGYASGCAHYRRRNCLLRNRLEAFNDRHGLINVSLQAVMSGSDHEQAPSRTAKARNTTTQKSFESYQFVVVNARGSGFRGCARAKTHRLR